MRMKIWYTCNLCVIWQHYRKSRKSEWTGCVRTSHSVNGRIGNPSTKRCWFNIYVYSERALAPANKFRCFYIKQWWPSLLSHQCSLLPPELLANHQCPNTKFVFALQVWHGRPTSWRLSPSSVSASSRYGCRRLSIASLFASCRPLPPPGPS